MFRFERADLNVGFAAVATMAVAVVLGAVYVWGSGTASGVFGFVLTWLAFAAAPSLSSSRAIAFGLVGGLVTLLAFMAAGSAGWSALVLGVVAALAALAAPRDSKVAVNWSLLAVWTLVALLIVEEGAAFQAASAFAVGSGVASGLVTLLRRSTRPQGTSHVNHESVTRPASWFAIGKGIAVALGVVIGFWLLPATPYWVALTVLIVAQPDDRTSLRTAFSRSIGTVLGVVTGALILSVTDGSEVVTAVALVGLVFFQMLFLKANYVLYATFLTSVIVVGASFTTEDVGGVGWSRILATVVGAVLAIALIEFMPDSAQPESGERRWKTSGSAP